MSEDSTDVIESFVDFRVKGGNIQYKVHWKHTGEHQDEWFDRTDLIVEHPDLVYSYEANIGGRPLPLVAGGSANKLLPETNTDTAVASAESTHAIPLIVPRSSKAVDGRSMVESDTAFPRPSTVAVGPPHSSPGATSPSTVSARPGTSNSSGAPKKVRSPVSTSSVSSPKEREKERVEAIDLKKGTRYEIDPVEVAEAVIRGIVLQMLKSIDGNRSLYGNKLTTVRSIFDAMDKDHDGILRWVDLESGLKRLDCYVTAAQLQDLLQVLDPDSQNFVTWGTFLETLFAVSSAETFLQTYETESEVSTKVTNAQAIAEKAAKGMFKNVNMKHVLGTTDASPSVALALSWTVSNICNPSIPIPYRSRSRNNSIISIASNSSNKTAAIQSPGGALRTTDPKGNGTVEPPPQGNHHDKLIFSVKSDIDQRKVATHAMIEKLLLNRISNRSGFPSVYATTKEEKEKHKKETRETINNFLAERIRRESVITVEGMNNSMVRNHLRGLSADKSREGSEESTEMEMKNEAPLSLSYIDSLSLKDYHSHYTNSASATHDKHTDAAIRSSDVKEVKSAPHHDRFYLSTYTPQVESDGPYPISPTDSNKCQPLTKKESFKVDKEVQVSPIRESVSRAVIVPVRVEKEREVEVISYEALLKSPSPPPLITPPAPAAAPVVSEVTEAAPPAVTAVDALKVCLDENPDLVISNLVTLFNHYSNDKDNTFNFQNLCKLLMDGGMDYSSGVWIDIYNQVTQLNSPPSPWMTFEDFAFFVALVGTSTAVTVNQTPAQAIKQIIYNNLIPLYKALASLNPKLNQQSPSGKASSPNDHEDPELISINFPGASDVRPRSPPMETLVISKARGREIKKQKKKKKKSSAGAVEGDTVTDEPKVETSAGPTAGGESITLDLPQYIKASGAGLAPSHTGVAKLSPNSKVMMKYTAVLESVLAANDLAVKSLSEDHEAVLPVTRYSGVKPKHPEERLEQGLVQDGLVDGRVDDILVNYRSSLVKSFYLVGSTDNLLEKGALVSFLERRRVIPDLITRDSTYEIVNGVVSEPSILVLNDDGNITTSFKQIVLSIAIRCYSSRTAWSAFERLEVLCFRMMDIGDKEETSDVRKSKPSLVVPAPTFERASSDASSIAAMVSTAIDEATMESVNIRETNEATVADESVSNGGKRKRKRPPAMGLDANSEDSAANKETELLKELTASISVESKYLQTNKQLSPGSLLRSYQELLYVVFTHFCKYGDRSAAGNSSHAALSGSKFVTLARHTGLVSASGLTVTDVDLVFKKTVQKYAAERLRQKAKGESKASGKSGGARLTFDMFKDAILLLSLRLHPALSSTAALELLVSKYIRPIIVDKATKA